MKGSSATTTRTASRAAVRSHHPHRPHTESLTQTYDYGAIPVVASRNAGAPCPDSGTWVQRPEEFSRPSNSSSPRTRASIQINLYRIAVAQAENRIDTRTANSMTWNQQVCLINLARKPLLESVPAARR